MIDAPASTILVPAIPKSKAVLLLASLNIRTVSYRLLVKVISVATAGVEAMAGDAGIMYLVSNF